MTYSDWSFFDSRADRARRSWPDTVAALPTGATVSGRVIARMPFGVFLDLDGHPDALGFVEITGFPAGRELPAVGSAIEGVVVDHAAHNHQVRLRPVTGDAGGPRYV